MLVHYLKTLKCLRSFKLKLNLGENIVELRIHDMGYFVFLTSENRLLIYTYLGELFVQSDLATEFDGERMTNMQFFSEWQSLVVSIISNLAFIDYSGQHLPNGLLLALGLQAKLRPPSIQAPSQKDNNCQVQIGHFQKLKIQR